MDKTALITRFEKLFEQIISNRACPAERLMDAIQYASFNGGKRLRPLLVYLVGQLFDTDLRKLDAPAQAIECIHCYSLIHDDLPAMDDDDIRRGKPSCHKKFDEATAILAGDALQALAFDIIAQSPYNTDSEKVNIIKSLTAASGLSGMAAGQMLDLMANHHQQDEVQLTLMHHLKTGCLINSAFSMAVSCSKADTKERQALSYCGNLLGLAFQIQDDYLDCYGSTDKLGKSCGSDIKQNKRTFASLYSEKALKEKYESLYEKLITTLLNLSRDTSEMEKLIEKLVDRQN